MSLVDPGQVFVSCFLTFSVPETISATRQSIAARHCPLFKKKLKCKMKMVKASVIYMFTASAVDIVGNRGL